MTVLKFLFILLISATPMLVAFGLAVLATVWWDKRLKEGANLSLPYRAIMLMILVAGWLLTAGATPTVAGLLGLLLGVGEGAAWRGLFFVFVAVASVAYAGACYIAYRDLTRSLRDARMYRAGMTKTEA